MPAIDPEVLQEAALQLREKYPDDEDFADAMERLKELPAETEGGEEENE